MMVQQERAARTRQSLMRAAAEAFAEDGFVPTTLSTISRRAGVSNGALHFHFENKHDLARAVEAAAADTVRAITVAAEQRQDSALQRLIDATHALMNSLDEDAVVRAGFELVGTAPRRGETEATDLRGEWQHWIDMVLHTAKDNGELADGVSAAEASTAVVAATVGFEVLGIKDPKWVSRRTLSQYWELMLPRLASPERLPELVPHGPGPAAPAHTPHP
ncbi:ScbR family autoregulator-binding transcription factor [Streptomyces aureoverticillatus]|uniref:ScbR family autoregulator-binding transcription factor n=2 Tax=Streptomyces TaxID=1883 RepID=UPI0013DCC072|nr:ScbR family autoregulator-binding transcription factor [Streptomyces aureoverticillatus]QIB41736.1 TetR/AcrR family transcriptional regulator [Streptomyces aureoverticillatus]